MNFGLDNLFELFHEVLVIGSFVCSSFLFVDASVFGSFTNGLLQWLLFFEDHEKDMNIKNINVENNNGAKQNF